MGNGLFQWSMKILLNVDVPIRKRIKFKIAVCSCKCRVYFQKMQFYCIQKVLKFGEKKLKTKLHTAFFLVNSNCSIFCLWIAHLNNHKILNLHICEKWLRFIKQIYEWTQSLAIKVGFFIEWKWNRDVWIWCKMRKKICFQGWN